MIMRNSFTYDNWGTFNVWNQNRMLSYQMWKADSITERLSNVHAWILNVKSGQSPTSYYEFINRNEKFKLIKTCPYTYYGIWENRAYLSVHRLLYNRLHDRLLEVKSASFLFLKRIMPRLAVKKRNTVLLRCRQI